MMTVRPSSWALVVPLAPHHLGSEVKSLQFSTGNATPRHIPAAGPLLSRDQHLHQHLPVSRPLHLLVCLPGGFSPEMHSVLNFVKRYFLLGSFSSYGCCKCPTPTSNQQELAAVSALLLFFPVVLTFIQHIPLSDIISNFMNQDGNP